MKSHNRTRHPTVAFTLVELLAVIAILSILAALFLPSMRGVFKKSEYVQAMSNMRQIGILFRTYAGDNDGQMPGRPGVPDPAAPVVDKWPAALSRYIAPVADTQNITQAESLKFKVYADPTDPHNFIKEGQRLANGGVAVAINPLSNSNNNTSFIMNGYNDLSIDPLTTPIQVRANGVFQPASTILLGVPREGNGQFFMDFAEGPSGNNNDVLKLNAHGSGSNYVMMDGSVQFISEEQYMDPAPEAPSLRYGDWLWLVDKTRTDIVQPPKS